MTDVSARIAVIGGGYSGFAAAVTVAELGHCATVFESGKTLGGRARRVDYRGETLDNGQHILSGAYTETLRLMRLVGVAESSLARTPLKLEMPPDFALVAPRWVAPLHLAWAIVTARGLSFSDRVGAMRFMRSLKRNRFKVDDALTVQSLLAREKQSPNLTRHLWQPLTVSALNTPIENASAQVFVNVLRDALASTREASDLLLPNTDLTALFPQVAATWLSARKASILTGTRVSAVSQTGSGFTVTSDTGTQLFDAVVVAIGPHQFDAIQLPPSIAPPAMSYEPIVTVYFKFATRVRLPAPMLGVAAGVTHWFFDRRQLGGDAKSPDGLIAAVISARGKHLELTAEDLGRRVLAELRQFIQDLPTPEWQKIITEKFATFACTPAVQASRPLLTTPVTGMFLAGDFVAGDYPATIEGAVRNGIRAAHSVATFLEKCNI